MPISGKLADRYERTPLLLVGTALVLFIPISVLRDHSKMREVSHRTETLRVGFQLIESFTHLINHGIKRGKSEIRELFFASFIPNVFHRVELGTVGRLRDEPNIVRDLQVFGHMLQKQTHHLRIGRRKDE